jgi:hypothetical protein
MQVSDDPAIQAHYDECRRQGTSHNLALMFAEAQPPMSSTDREFMRGTENGRQFQGNQRAGNEYRRVAESMGQNTKGKKYLSSLAEFPGDPKAWVDSRADVQKVCEERGWGCTGAVNVKHRTDTAPPAPIAVGEDIVQAEVQREVAEGSKEKPKELREKVIAKRKPHWVR